MKMFQVAALTVVLSAVAVAAHAKSPTSGASAKQTSSTSAKTQSFEKQVDSFLMPLQEMGMTGRPLSPAEFGFLLEVSGILVNTKSDLGFLLEVSGLNRRSLQRSDVQILLYFGATKGFTATDDLAKFMAEIADSNRW